VGLLSPNRTRLATLLSLWQETVTRRALSRTHGVSLCGKALGALWAVDGPQKSRGKYLPVRAQ
jgi:hypothetical protein